METTNTVNSNEVNDDKIVKSKDEQERGGKTKTRKKELRNVEHLLKSMSSAGPEEKLQVFCQKYAEVLEENKTIQTTVKQYERKLQVLQREKEQLQTENSKGVLARSRLEELCRELQRQNKAVKEESLLRIREEEERRKEVAVKFQSTLSEVSTLLQQNNEKNTKLREENSEMATKLQTLCDQYALREQHLEKLAKQYDIERQLNEARLAKARMEAAEDKEKMLRDKQQLLLELTEYQKKCQLMQQEELALREQLSMYTDKYDDFQKALNASNKTFTGFKEQMDAMTRKLKNLEKETAQWKQRWENSNKALIELAAEKKARDNDLINATKQLTQLEKLCRALQGERASLLNQLKVKSDCELQHSKKTVTNAAEGTSSSTEESRPLPSPSTETVTDQLKVDKQMGPLECNLGKPGIDGCESQSDRQACDGPEKDLACNPEMTTETIVSQIQPGLTDAVEHLKLEESSQCTE